MIRCIGEQDRGFKTQGLGNVECRMQVITFGKMNRLGGENKGGIFNNYLDFEQ